MKAKKPFDRKNSKYCVEYWIARGHSEAEGRSQISQIQRELGARRRKGIKLTDQQKLNISLGTKQGMSESHMILKYGQDEGTRRYEDLKRAVRSGAAISYKKKLDSNHNFKEDSTRCVEYWTKRGHSLSDAKQFVSKSQARDLSFFIAKYGKSLGIEKWKKKTATWKKSFQANDVNAINEKRRLNAHVGLYSAATIQNIDRLFLYVILLRDTDGTDFIKYGLTKHDTLGKRWSVSLDYRIIVFAEYDARIALQKETAMSDHFKQSYSPMIIHTTECCAFSDMNLLTILNIVENT